MTKTADQPTRPIKRYNYIDGPAIYVDSFAFIRRESALSSILAEAERLGVSITHGIGQPNLVKDLAIHLGVVSTSRAAPAARTPILCDAHMAVTGVTASRLPAVNAVRCPLREPGAPPAPRPRSHCQDLDGRYRDHDRQPIHGAAPPAGNPSSTAPSGPRPSSASRSGSSVRGVEGGADRIRRSARYRCSVGDDSWPPRGGSAMTSSTLNALASEAE
ncbi:precorrin-8X methylmutase [Mycolicibacterium boenickei]